MRTEENEPLGERDAAYDLIDRFLRNNLDDTDYAEHSAALDSIYTRPAARAESAGEAEPVAFKSLKYINDDADLELYVQARLEEDRASLAAAPAPASAPLTDGVPEKAYLEWLRSQQPAKAEPAVAVQAEPGRLTGDNLRKLWVESGEPGNFHGDFIPMARRIEAAALAAHPEPAVQSEGAPGEPAIKCLESWHQGFLASSKAQVETDAEQPKPLDDPRLQQLFGDTIWGAYAKGLRNIDSPPEGHWLARWWAWGASKAPEPAAPAMAEEARGEVGDFYTGICVALAVVRLFDQETCWREIVKTAGEQLTQYAAYAEPDEWDLAGFAHYLKRKPARAILALRSGASAQPAEAALKEAFQEGFYSVQTYNDIVLNDSDAAWQESRTRAGAAQPAGGAT